MKASEAGGTGPATGEGTGAATEGTVAEPWGMGAGGPETGAGGLLQGLLNPRCPVWSQLGL